MNNHTEVSWGNVLQDDILVWIPHALCRYSHELGLTFDDIGFIVQLFSFRGPEGIHPSDSTLAMRGGFKTRNSIIDRYKRLEDMGYVVRHRTRISGRFSSCQYDFSPLRQKLEELVERDWASGTRKRKVHRVDNNQHGERQHDDNQHDERQQKKLKYVETQGFLETQESSSNGVSQNSELSNPQADDDCGKNGENPEPAEKLQTVTVNAPHTGSQSSDNVNSPPAGRNNVYPQEFESKGLCLEVEQKLDELGILRGSLSSNDMVQITQLEKAGVSIDLVLSTMDAVTVNNRASPNSKAIRSFGYFVPAIMEAHEVKSKVKKKALSERERMKKRLEEIRKEIDYET